MVRCILQIDLSKSV